LGCLMSIKIYFFIRTWILFPKMLVQ
jgi:hypothetical protein